MGESKSSGSGVGFTGLLTVLFIGLKLTGHIDWSWWWVLSPAWGTLAFIVAVLAIAFVVALASESRATRQRARKRGVWL